MEKITPDIVGKLSLSDFKELGMQSPSDIVVLQLECIKYGSETPREIEMDFNVVLHILMFPSQFWNVILIMTLREMKKFFLFRKAQFIDECATTV